MPYFARLIENMPEFVRKKPKLSFTMILASKALFTYVYAFFGISM